MDDINNTKFLGVSIDSKLNWAAHLLYTTSKISKSIDILLKIRKFLQNKTEKYVHFHSPITNLLYRSLGKCLTYAFRSTNKDTEKSIRTITSSHYLAHAEPLFERLNILDIEKLVMQRISLIMFKN